MTAQTNLSPRGAIDPTWIAPHRTALCLIDLQTDFASPAGQMAAWGADLSSVPHALSHCGKLLEGARASCVPVVFVRLETRPETDSRTWKEWMRRRDGEDDSVASLCRVGSRGADFYGLAPIHGEQVVAKSKYSAFYGTDFERTLRRRGVDTLVFAGLTTECCVDATVRDAFHRDFYCIVASDACAAYEPALHAHTLRVLELNCALIASSDAIISSWCEGARRAQGLIGRQANG